MICFLFLFSRSLVCLFPYLGLLGVELLAESDAELLAQTLEVLEVLLVLLVGLDLGLDTCWERVSFYERFMRSGRSRTFEDANSGREVVDAAGGLQGGGEDLNGRDEIVGEAVVQIPLEKGNVSLNCYSQAAP